METTFKKTELKNLTVGDRIYFLGEKKAYTIRARNDRFLICTYPAFGTVVYSIVDLDNDIRGTHNYVFSPFDLVKTEDCENLLAELSSGECEISRRNTVWLEVDYCRTDLKNK